MQKTRTYPRRGSNIKPSKNKFPNRLLEYVIAISILVVLLLAIKYHFNHNYSNSPNIKLASSGYCLDDYQNRLSDHTRVDSWQCNSSQAQVWSVQGMEIVHENKYCLSVENNAVAQNSKVVMDTCDNSAGQIWLRDKGGFQNPNSTLCLTASSINPTQSLYIGSCSDLGKSIETWSPVANVNSTKILNTSCSGNKGALVACYAEREWSIWQSGTTSHENMLNTYTNGSPSEEWCADFVSYVYKEAGFPFTQGSSNGWDENNANYVQYMGFTIHLASSGYSPQPGDVAYFDYNDGHVEIVASGGKTPTFIYGDSATIDPTTGNGQMKANTILGDSNGQVVYYLSPD